MPRDPRKLLYDMLDSCRFVVEFSAGREIDDLRTDRGFRSAIERELQVVGEALAALVKVAPELAERIEDNQRIIRFRHVLVHGYEVVDQDIVWTILREKVPPMVPVLERLLGGTLQPRQNLRGARRPGAISRRPWLLFRVGWLR